MITLWVESRKQKQINWNPPDREENWRGGGVIKLHQQQSSYTSLPTISHDISYVKSTSDSMLYERSDVYETSIQSVTCMLKTSRKGVFGVKHSNCSRCFLISLPNCAIKENQLLCCTENPGRRHKVTSIRLKTSIYIYIILIPEVKSTTRKCTFRHSSGWLWTSRFSQL